MTAFIPQIDGFFFTYLLIRLIAQLIYPVKKTPNLNSFFSNKIFGTAVYVLVTYYKFSFANINHIKHNMQMELYDSLPVKAAP